MRRFQVMINSGVVTMLIAVWFVAISGNSSRANSRHLPLNVIRDGGFESVDAWSAGGQNALQLHVEQYGDIQARVHRDQSTKFSGNHSLHFVVTRSQDGLLSARQFVRLEPNKKYRIWLWARAEGLAERGLSVVLKNSQVCLPPPIQLRGGTYDWTPMMGEFNVSSDLLEEGPLELTLTASGHGEAWIDDVQIMAVDDSSNAHATDAPQLLRDTAAASADFRQLAIRDAGAAMKRYVQSNRLARAETMGKLMWRTIEPQKGWSLFFNSAVVIPVGDASDAPLIAFYNPWCDVALITVWRSSASEEGDEAKITSMEALLGDYLRSGGLMPRQPKPAWLHYASNRPAALGLAVARTAEAVEHHFGAEGGNQWRQKLAGANSKDVLHLNYKAVALNVLDMLGQMQEFHLGHDEEPDQLPEVRRQVHHFLTAAAAGEIAELVDQAEDTPSEVRPLLLQTPAEQYDQLVVIRVCVEESTSEVFLVPAKNADFCLALQFEHGATQTRLSRIEPIVYDPFYQFVRHNWPP